MSTAIDPTSTLADLVEQLGQVPLARIRLWPSPGTATEADVLAVEARERRLCELVDGVLVEKAMGYVESVLAMYLGMRLNQFVTPGNLGLVSGEAGMLRLFAGLVRIPDVAFASWASIPGGIVPKRPIPELVPDLVVEVLSESNTPQEMERKRREYFQAGVRCVWIVDPEPRTVAVYDSPTHAVELRSTDVLTGDPVLPGFALPLAELFAQLDRSAQG